MSRRIVALLALLAVSIVGAVLAQRWMAERERLETCGFDEAQLDQLTTDAEHRVLFIGNSFVGNHGIDEMVRELLIHGITDSAASVRVWGPGMTLSGHVGQEGSPRGQCLRTLLSETSSTVRAWDLVVLQEQSQLPTRSKDLPEMRTAAAALGERAQQGDAKVILLSTWGYRDGDPRTAEDVRSFPAMTRTLDTNIRSVAAQLGPLDVSVAPAGLAFLKVYEGVQRQGEDPMAAGSPFRELYAPDGRHPSVRGSYLAACVVYAVYTGASPVGIEWAPPGISSRTRGSLQAIAAAAALPPS